ncbi:putative zinc-finger [Longilinea arvoryzae]|uniref:Putative zinc-finger n=1 Tax=Longilinea arvoryzae TaxID=360412 RepID=A0A0S7BD84_9CHLR|nr:zf-HC2 domain-containing protein [Longilinea arvoryzae]GAP12692.1 putative zinc-finger [Longilinea arvoryzae]
MSHYRDELPLYVAGQLKPQEKAAVDAHLRECVACRDELAIWLSLAVEIRAADAKVTAPAGLAERALERIHTPEAEPKPAPRLWRTCQSVFSLLRAQAYLIKREIWPATAGIMALGVILGLLSNHVEAISYIAPLVAAAGLTALYGPENDPAHELVLATPTSSWKILLARLSVVSAYNLLLALLASLAMLLIVPPNLLGMIILGWLAPMAFLSALALLLSLWMKTSTAIAIAYGLWILQYMKFSKVFDNWGISVQLNHFLDIYRSFWQSPELLLIFALVLLAIGLFSTHFSEHSLNQTPG